MTRYIQHPETHKLIPADEYEDPRRPSGPYIMPDIQKPFTTDSGEKITTRSRLRQYMRETGMVPLQEMDNVRQDAVRNKRDWEKRNAENRKQAVIDAYHINEKRSRR